MKKFVFISLVAYLGALAATQTVYGGRFLTLRWVALIALLVSSGLYWVAIRGRKGRGSSLDQTSSILLVYLTATCLTVMAGENPLFSGFRWASHAMMLVIFLIFLCQNITVLQPQRILLILKIIIGILLFISLVRPAAQTIYDNLEVFRGAMGNANTMGQIGAIGTLLYFHSYLNERNRWIRYILFGLSCGAVVIVWKSGSRSAVVALLSGIGLLALFYRRKMKGKIFWTILLICIMALIFPKLPREAERFIGKSEDTLTVVSEQMTKSRKDVWRAAWDGFKQRPIFGWGFGADSGITKNWNFGLTALGMVERDPVNDFLFMLEGCGIIGFGAYFLLIYIGLKQMPTGLETFNLKKGNNALPMHQAHAIFFSIVVSLLVLVQFDSTALSAGNFIPVILWLSVGAAGALRREAKMAEIAMRNYIRAEAIRTRGNTSASSVSSR
jgi:O-antigen ligase